VSLPQGKTEEEMEKRLGAAFIAGDLLISIDNCEQPLRGELLCQALTQPLLKIRFLGKSLNIEVPSNAFICATGNNLTLAGDMTRRALLCSLDAGVERPELRVFEDDHIAEVEANRAAYLVAALTVLRAFHVAGRPKQSDPLGSFAEWSRLVRGALLWLGEADPVATMEKVRGADPKLEALSRVLQLWSSAFGDQRVSARQIIDRVEAAPTNRDFRDALLDIAGESGVVSSKRLGKWLSDNQRRVVGGLNIVPAKLVTGIQHWRVVTVDLDAQVA
jgi:putative DNA primase/helicase